MASNSSSDSPTNPNGSRSKTAGDPLSDARNLTRKSQSDGSLTNDAREVTENARSGAKLGSKVAGAKGAAVGTAVGAGVGVAKNKNVRRRVGLVVGVPVLVVSLLVSAVAAAVTSTVTGSRQSQAEARQKLSWQAATADGLSAAQVNNYVEAAEDSGVQWPLLAAVDWSAGEWVGQGDPAYGIEDLERFNKALAQHGIPTLASVKDRVAAGYAFGRLFAATMLAANPDNTPDRVDAGAVIMPDPSDSDRKVRRIDHDDADSVAAHEAAKKSFTSTLADMPSTIAEDEEQIFQTAFRWATGQQMQQQTPATACTPAGQTTTVAASVAVDVPSAGSLPEVTGLTSEQVHNAATIVAVGKAHDLPPKAWKIALMASLVETRLQNLDYGHADSLGLFQQRPAAGWGTKAAIMDPVKATEAFFGVANHTDNPGLGDIAGWQQMALGDAAQAVQMSATPLAYAQEDAMATILLKTLEGVEVSAAAGSAVADCSTAALGDLGSCPPSPFPKVEEGLTADALRVLRCSAQQAPEITTVYGLSGTLDHPRGKAVDLMISGAFDDYKSPAAKEYGWKLAKWLKANQKPLGIHYIIWDAKIWNIERDDEGWRDYDSITGSNNDSSLHYNHIHVSVYGNKGVLSAATNLADGSWVLPTGENFMLGPGVCTAGTDCWGYGSHTGQDLSIYEDAPIRAVAGGTVTTAKVLCPDLSNAQREGNASCSYGRFVVIDHGGGVESYYAHLNGFGPGIAPGVSVKAGQVIGYEGSQGHSSGPHLHLEIRKDGAIMNPVTYLEGQGIPLRCSQQMKGIYGNVPAGEC